MYYILEKICSYINQFYNDISKVNTTLSKTDEKLYTYGMKNLSITWANDILEFKVDDSRIFGIKARWNGGNYE